MTEATNKRETSFLEPISLGLFLQRTGVTCSKWPGRPYRGIDRLPYVPSPLELEDLRSSGSNEWADIWDAYWDAWESSSLRVDLRLIQKVRRDFLRYNLEFEIVFGEIAAVPKNLQAFPHGSLWERELQVALARIRRTTQEPVSRPPQARFLGFDLSHPVPSFHSAIFQPGLHSVHPRLPDQLNMDGLFDDLNTALRFLDAANQMDYGVLPFCVIGIWEVPSTW